MRDGSSSPAVAEGGRAPPPYPSLFIKSSTTIAGYNSITVVPKCAQENEADYEAEMCIVIGEDCKDVSVEKALDYVAGYTVGNDVSSRKWQREPSRAGGVPQWCFSKVSRNEIDSFLGKRADQLGVRRILSYWPLCRLQEGEHGFSRGQKRNADYSAHTRPV